MKQKKFINGAIPVMQKICKCQQHLDIGMNEVVNHDVTHIISLNTTRGVATESGKVLELRADHTVWHRTSGRD